MSYDILHVRLTAMEDSPLLMHADTMVDALHPLTQRFNAVADKKKGSKDRKVKLELDMQLSEIEWRAGLYYTPKTGPYVPGANIVAAVRDAAKLKKKGKDIERTVMPARDFCVLNYEGPRNIDALWDSKDPETGHCVFADRRSVVVSRARVIRTRPKFLDWTLDTSLFYSGEYISKKSLLEFLAMAGMAGMCDYRQRFGKFTVAEI